MIIGICGLIGSGKDTIAAHLVKTYGYQRYSWAAPLKDITSVLFGWDRSMLEGTTPDQRSQRETKDDWWSSKLGKEWSPRYALQYIGTEVMRNSLHQDIWVLAGQRRIASMGDVVIPDTRFPNEIQAIRELGGEIWQVCRGPDPEWYKELTFFKSYMKEHATDAAVTEYMQSTYPNIHASEYGWHGQRFDRYLHNHGNIDDLIPQIDLKIRDQTASVA